MLVITRGFFWVPFEADRFLVAVSGVRISIHAAYGVQLEWNFSQLHFGQFKTKSIKSTISFPFHRGFPSVALSIWLWPEDAGALRKLLEGRDAGGWQRRQDPPFFFPQFFHFNQEQFPYPLVNERKYGKSQSLIGKSTIDGPFSIAMLNYQRVYTSNIRGFTSMWWNELRYW